MVYSFIEDTNPPDAPTLKLQNISNSLTSAQQAIRGPVSFAQTCRLVRSEYLPIPVHDINTLTIPFHHSVSFIQTIVLPQQYNVWLPKSAECKLNIDMAIPEDDDR